MTTLSGPPTMPAYTEEDHQVWAALYARQMPHMEAHACRLFREGFPRLGLDPQRLPDPAVVSERLYGLSGWTLGDAQNAYLGPTEWFEHIAERRFPVTNYIRKMDELEFTPLPDLFHEYFGHLAFFTDRRFGDMLEPLGRAEVGVLGDAQGPAAQLAQPLADHGRVGQALRVEAELRQAVEE
jgi:phenylalanine-4-hydroxylase